MSMSDIGIPFIGIVSAIGYVESYDYKKAEECDFHHSFALSKKGCSVYDEENTLRFVMYKDTDTYTLEGSPALDPFNKGAKQIRLFATHVLENGANPDTMIEIAQHYLKTEWEGQTIGRVIDWV